MLRTSRTWHDSRQTESPGGCATAAEPARRASVHPATRACEAAQRRRRGRQRHTCTQLKARGKYTAAGRDAGCQTCRPKVSNSHVQRTHSRSIGRPTPNIQCSQAVSEHATFKSPPTRWYSVVAKAPGLENMTGQRTALHVRIPGERRVRARLGWGAGRVPRAEG